MNTVKNTLTVIAVCLLLGSCAPETGNPDLAGTWSCTETSQIFLKTTKGTSVYEVTFIRDAVNPESYRIDNIYKLGT
ncbi:MAG: hypothetical protein WCW62_15675, partial [Bacteroidales bacterium]